MNALWAWLVCRKRRRATRRLMRKLIAGIERRTAFEEGIWRDLADTDFAALWADYAATISKDVEDLTIEDKKQAHLNYVLRDRKR